MRPRTMVLLAAVLFGTTGTAQALADVDAPVAVGAGRIVVGAVLLALAAWLLAPAARGALRWSRGALAGAGVGVAIYQVSFFAAVDITGVAVGTVVAIGSGPVFAGLAARAVLGAPLDARWAGCTALAIAGAALLLGAGAEDASVSAPGVALALVAGAGYGGYTVMAKRLLDDGHAAEAVMARAFGLGAVLLLPVLAVVGGDAVGSPRGIALVLYLGALPTAVAYVLFARGLRRLPAADTATLTLAEPLVAATLGVALLGERPGAAAAVGAALLVAALAALALAPARRPAAAGAP